jgi:hypothetical protein
MAFFMKINAHLFLTPVLVAILTASCDIKKFKKQESIEANTAKSFPGEFNASNSSTLREGSHLIYEETMEGRNPFSTAKSHDNGDWKYALQYVTNPVFQGLKAARFEIRKDEPRVQHSIRSEVTIVKGEDIGKNAWYSFSAYFPAVGYEYDTEREVINQWYQDGSPATSLRTKQDRFILETGNTPDNRKQYDLGPIVKDAWQEFVFHFIHSHGSDGLIEVWLNGAKVFTYTGGNMYDDALPKWKIGLYKAAFKYGTSSLERRVIYFDNIRVGNSDAAFADMTSGFSELLSNPRVVSYTLVNAGTEKDVMTITNGTTISLSALDLIKVNIRANTQPLAVGSVKFILTGERDRTHTDAEFPFALMGDDGDGNYYYRYWDPPPFGTYMLVATPYSGSNGNGIAGISKTITFTIVK